MFTTIKSTTDHRWFVYNHTVWTCGLHNYYNYYYERCYYPVGTGVKHLTQWVRWVLSAINGGELVKGKDNGKGNVDLYSTSLWMPLTCSDMDNTVFPADNTISAFTSKHSSGGATMHIHIAKEFNLLLIYQPPRMAELAMLADIQ